MKSIITALLLTAAVPNTAFAATPDTEMETAAIEMGAAADPQNPSKEMDEMMAMFSKLFDTSKLPPPDPARLKLAETTASRLLPDGAYAKIMNDMLGSFVLPVLDAMPGLSDVQIASKTGASSEAVAALSAENKEAVTLIIDPNFKQRGEQLMSVVKPIITDVMADLEPAMRTGLSRAYARKFSVAELDGINGFFATPTGANFARESFALQADPEVLQAVFKAIPAMLGKFMGSETKYKAQFDALPKERKLSEMSDAELQKLSTLLGVTVKSLKDHKEVEFDWTADLPGCAKGGDETDCTDADWAASGAAQAAAEAAADAADAAAVSDAEFIEAQKKLRAAWSKADLKAVEQAEAAQIELWDRHDRIDNEMNDAQLRVEAAINAAKRNAGQPVEEDQLNDATADVEAVA